MKAPPAQHLEVVIAELASRLGLSDGEKHKMQTAMHDRETKVEFTTESFFAATAKLGDTMKA